MKKQHTHAWETVQRCFECDQIREYSEDEIPIFARPCPSGSQNKRIKNMTLPTCQIKVNHYVADALLIAAYGAKQ